MTVLNYHQMTGLLRDEAGKILGAGYSGHEDGRNNPDAASTKGIGPLPVGDYALGAPINHPKLGPLAFPLTPFPGVVQYGRSGFFIHGDAASHPGLASDGCIILAQLYRAPLAELLKAGPVIIRVVNTPSPYKL